VASGLSVSSLLYFNRKARIFVAGSGAGVVFIREPPSTP
jgi:hypothetical protein